MPTTYPPREEVNGDGWDALLAKLEKSPGNMSSELIEDIRKTVEAGYERMERAARTVSDDAEVTAEDRGKLRRLQKDFAAKLSTVIKFGAKDIGFGSDARRMVDEARQAEATFWTSMNRVFSGHVEKKDERAVRDVNAMPASVETVPEDVSEVSAPAIDSGASAVSPRSGTRRRGTGGTPDEVSNAEERDEREEVSAFEAEEPFTRREGREALVAAVASVADLDAVRLKEVKESLQNKAAADEIQKVPVAQAERAAVQEKEAEYLAAFKDLEKKRTVWGRIANRKALKEGSAKVEALKSAFDESRVAYAAAISKNVEDKVAERSENFEERTREKYDKLKASGMLARTEDGEELSFEAFARRSAARAENTQERVSSYLRFREVIRPLAEKKLEARREALDERGRSAFDKALGWSARKNQELEKALGGKVNARIVRAAASVALISLGTAALGVAGVMAPVGLTALAVGGGARFARSLWGAFAGAAAAEAGGVVFDTFGRKAQREAAAQLRRTGKNMSGAEALSLDDLQRADAKRDKLAKGADEATFQKNKAIVKALTALGVGAGTAGILAEFSTMQHAAEAVVGAESADLTGMPVKGAGELVQGPPTDPNLQSATSAGATAAPSPEAAAASVTGTAPAPEGFQNLLRGATIHTPGQGMGELFVDLRHQLNADMAAIPNPSPALAHVLGSNPNALTHELLAANGGESVTMHTGDQIMVDENQNVWFQAKGGEPRMLYENDPTAPGGFKVHALEDLHKQPDIHHEGSSDAVQQNEPEATANTGAGGAAESTQYMTNGEPIAIDQAHAVGHGTDPGELTHMPTVGHLDPTPKAEYLAETPAPRTEHAAETHVEPVKPTVEAPHANEVQSSVPAAQASTEGIINAHGAHLEKPDLLLDAEKHRFAYVPRTGDVLADSEARYQLATAEAMKQPGKPIYFVSETQTALGTVERSVRAVYFDPTRARFPLPYSVDGSGAEYVMPKVPADSDLYPTPSKK